MISFLRGGVALLALAGAAAGPARATELCGWLIETVEADGLHQFDLWLQADADTDVFYRMTGDGWRSEGVRAYSPGSGTYSLHAHKAAKVWGFGTSLNPPGELDIVAEIHAPPASVFSEDETPLLATFAFRRHVPEDEGPPPKAFGARQCVTVAAGR